MMSYFNIVYPFIISSQADAENSNDNDDENANDNLGHKELEQWGEKNKMEAVGMDAMEVDDQTGQSVNLSICMAIYLYSFLNESSKIYVVNIHTHDWCVYFPLKRMHPVPP